MDVSLGVSIVFAIAFGGFLITKKPGFGRHSTSIFLLILVLYVASLAFFTGKIDWVPLANILFAIAGYAGGLVAAHKLPNEG